MMSYFNRFLTLLLSLSLVLQTTAPSFAQAQAQPQTVDDSAIVRELPPEFQEGGTYDPERVINWLAQMPENQNVENVPVILRAFERLTAVPLSQAEGDQQKLVEDAKDLVKLDIGSFVSALDQEENLKPADRIQIKRKMGVLTRLMLFGHARAYYSKIEEIIHKLAIKGEPNYQIQVSASPLPNAAIDPTNANMFVNFGLLAWTPTEDHLAGVIAHEMTHAHKEHLKAAVDIPFANDVLDKLEGYSSLSADQREEIRADLGAVDRLIRAGYNPWTYYEFEKKFTSWFEKSLDSRLARIIYQKLFRRSFDYMEAHPAGEIRMSAVKAYILHRGFQEDISELTQKKGTPFPVSIKLLRKRAQALAFPLTNVWVQRSLIAYTGYTIVSAVFGFSLPPEVTQPIAAAFHAVGSGLSFAYNTAIAPALSPIGSVASAFWDLLEPIRTPITQAWASIKGAYNSIPAVQDGTVGSVTGNVFAYSFLAMFAKMLEITVFFMPVVMAYHEDIQQITELKKKINNLNRLFGYSISLLAKNDPKFGRVQGILVRESISALNFLFGRYFSEAALRLNKRRTNLYPMMKAYRELLVKQLELATSAESPMNDAQKQDFREALLKGSSTLPASIMANKEVLAGFTKLFGRFDFRGFDDMVQRITFWPQAFEVLANDLRSELKGEYSNDAIFEFLSSAANEILRQRDIGNREEDILQLMTDKFKSRFTNKTSPISQEAAFNLSKRLMAFVGDAEFRGWQHPLLRALALVQVSGMENLNLSPADEIRFARLLAEEGFYSEARARISPRLGELENYVYSASNTKPELARDLSQITAALKMSQTDKRTSLAKRYAWDVGSAVDTAIGWFKGITNTIQNFSANRTVPITGGRWTSIRYWVQRAERNKIIEFFEGEFKSIRDLVAFVDTELLPNNIQVNQLSYELNYVVSKHPEWFQTDQDFDLALSKEYFWPQVNSEGVETLSFEQGFKSAMTRLSKDFPRIWKYDPGASEKIHHAYLQALKSSGRLQVDHNYRLSLWLKLVERGVTAVTDSLFSDLYAEADQNLKSRLETLALQGYVWESTIKGKIARKLLYGLPEYRSLLNETRVDVRHQLISKLIDQLKEYLPEGGAEYSDILEEISVAIRSTPSEAEHLESAKGKVGGERAEDLSLRIFSEFIKYVLKWRKADQWNLILFLRGDAEPSESVKTAFRLLGTTRIQRMFSLMPQLARTQLLDTLLDSPEGLVPSLNPEKGYGKLIIDHILRNSTGAGRQVASEVLEAFLYSLEASGNSALRSYVLSYLLAMPNRTTSTGEILKNVLELFGTSGIKIGQFLAAAQVLPEEETKHLRRLQDQASKPLRIKIYQDLSDMSRGQTLPFVIDDLLGAASLKYAVSARANGTDERVVLKILRLEAIANTRTQFKQLEAMAEYLTTKKGAKYGVFQSIVKASRAAVERELKLEGEYKRSRVARHVMYGGGSVTKDDFSAPFEVMLGKRLIVAEFAEGSSVFELPADVQKEVALRILQRETANFFKPLANDSDILVFDPDRHAGNYRVYHDKNTGVVRVHPIDFGQLLVMTKRQRDQALDLFALSQVLLRAGSSDWAIEKVEKILGLQSVDRVKLKRAMSRYFPDGQMKEVTGYYSLLAALNDANIVLDITFFDFVRGLIQLSQYEALLGGLDPKDNPVAILRSEVERRARVMGQQVQLNASEKVKYLRNELRDTFRDRGLGATCQQLLTRTMGRH